MTYFLSTRKGLTVLTAVVALILVIVFVTFFALRSRPHADSLPAVTSIQLVDARTGIPLTGLCIVNLDDQLDTSTQTDVRSIYSQALDSNGLVAFPSLDTTIPYAISVFRMDTHDPLDLGIGDPTLVNLTAGQVTQVPVYNGGTCPPPPTESSTPTPTTRPSVTPSPLAATINSFTATPASITTATNVSLYYNVTNAKSASIDNGIGALAITNNTAVATKSLTVSKTTTYTLTVVGLDGKTVTKQQTVTFTLPKPAAPTITNTLSDPITVQLSWNLPVALTTTGDGITLTRTNPDGTVTSLAVGNASTSYTDTNLSPAINGQTNNYKYSISIKHNGVSSDISTTTANVTLTSDTTLLNATNFTIKKSSGTNKLTWTQKGTKPNNYLLMDGKTPLAILPGTTTTTTMTLTSGHMITLYGYNKQVSGFSASTPITAVVP